MGILYTATSRVVVQAYQTRAHSLQSGALRPTLCLVQFRVLLHTTLHFLHHFGLVSSATSYTVGIYIPPYTPAVRAAFDLLLLRNSAFCVSSFWSICCSGVVVVVVKGALLSVVRPFTFAGPTLHLLSFVCAVCVPDRASLSVVKCALIALVHFDLAPLSSCGVLGSWNFLVHLAL